MDSQKLMNVIQITTGLAVLVGIGLVVWELRQTRQFMEFELVDRTFAEALETRRSEIGEDVMSSYAKACAGEVLSQKDRLVLDRYFLMMFSLVTRQIATLDQL